MVLKREYKSSGNLIVGNNPHIYADTFSHVAWGSFCCGFHFSLLLVTGMAAGYLSHAETPPDVQIVRSTYVGTVCVSEM